MKTNERQNPALLEPRSFIDSVPAFAWAALPDGSLNFFNHRLQDYAGLTPNQLQGSKWNSIVYDDDIPELESWWRDLQQSPAENTTVVRLRSKGVHSASC
jgi:PAS domain S-box-containing protein